MKKLRKLVVLLTVLTVAGLTMGMKAVFAETTSGLDVFSNFNSGSTTGSTDTSTTTTTTTNNQGSTQTTTTTNAGTTGTTATTNSTNTSASSLTVTPSTSTNNTTVVNNINSEVNKIPQTGENDVYIITAIGAVALAIGGVAYFKARKLDM